MIWIWPMTHDLLLLHTTHDCISWPMIMASANITSTFTKKRKSWLLPLAYDCGPWLMIVAQGL
jgi:hypothetical protein